jgi:tape measure domain-containing protein
LSVYELGIDGTSAEAGANRIVKSFEEIKAAAARMEGSTKKSFSGMAEAYRQLASMKAPTSQMVGGLRDLSNVISGFKGPSQANLSNTQNFFTFLRSISGLKLSGGAGIKAFLDPISNYKGPSASAADSTKVLLKAVSSFSGAKGTGLREFLSTFEGFKGPSQASAKNVRTLLAAVSGFNAPRVGGLSALLSTLAGYAGPTAGGARNTRTLLNALNGMNAVRVPASFTAFLTSLAGFKGPGATAGKNTLSLLNALSTFTPPKNIGSTVTRFKELADAIDKAANSMTRLRAGSRGNLSVPGMPKGGSGAINAYARSFGGLETAVFRTQTALNALGGVLGVKFIASASGQITKIRAQLEAATGSTAQANLQFGFLRDESQRLGLEFTTTAKSYGMLLASIKGTTITFAEAQSIFKGFSTAARALQLSTEDIDGVFRALGQIMSKGKLQAEELRGQLGDRLPGAFTRFAVALKMTKPGQLDDALKKGAISGEILKKALLSVANTMETEFAGAAVKSSRTVDAAFNRLKNAFTFGAAEFGANGFNDALKALADTLTKLIQNKAVNAAFSGIAAALKLLGNNLTLIAAIATGIGVASFGKWAIAATAASSAVTVLMKAIQAGRLIALALAAGQAARAFGILNLVMKANIFGIVATAVAGLIYYISTATNEVSEFNKYIGASSTALELGKNITEAYISTVADMSNGLINNTNMLDENTRKTIENYNAKMLLSASTGVQMNKVRKGDDIKGSGSTYDFLGLGIPIENDWNRKTASKSGVTFSDANGIAISDPMILKALVGARNKDGNIRDYRQSPENLRRLLRSSGELGTRLEMDSTGGAPLPVGQRETIQAEKNRIDYQVNGARNNKKLGYSFDDTVKQVYKNGIEGPAQVALIKGDVPEKVKKPKKDTEASQFAADLDRAQRAYEALDRKIQGTKATVLGFLDSSSSAIAAAANATAKDKVEQLEDAFDPKKREAGVLAMARAMGVEGKSYKDAKDNLVALYAKQVEREERSKNDLSVAKTVSDLREENAVRARNVESVYKNGTALREANVQIEIEKQLLGGSAEMRDTLTEKLKEQYAAQQRLNDAQDVGDAVRTATSSQAVQKMVSPTYTSGLLPDEIDRYKELATYFQELKDKGYDAGTITYLTSLRKATMAQDAALKTVTDQYEGIRQLAQDTADNLVDGLRDAFSGAGDAGDNFLDRMNNVFKSLKTTILNFVLFDPLKNYLTDTLTRSFSTGMISKKSRDTLQRTTDAVGSKLDEGRDLVGNMTASIDTTALDNAANKVGTAAYDISVAAVNLNNAAVAINTAAGGPTSAGLGAATVASGGGAVAGMFAGAGAFSAASMLVAKRQANLTGQAVADTIQSGEFIAMGPRKDAVAPLPERQQNQYFERLKNVFDHKSNKATLFSSLKGPNGETSALTDFKSAFSGSTKGLGNKLDAFGKGVGKVAGVATKAFAAYEMGSGIAKTLGLGKGGQKVAGGASAGFAVAGPVGAAVGAVAGGVLAMLAKPKFAASAVTVGANGRATAQDATGRGSAMKDAAKASSAAGAALFGQVATQLDSYLTAGNYGTFGEAKIKGKENNKFYSVTGKLDKKGRPVGVRGVDYLNTSDEDQLQAFALKAQIKTGKFGDLDPVYSTIARNTTATTTADLSTDLGVGKDYLSFIESAKVGSDLQKQTDALDKSYKNLTRSSAALGLDTAALTRAYNQQKTSMRNAFNNDINQQILEIKDPLLASYNALVTEYEAAVGNAQAVGGDLAKVEELYGLKRLEIVKDYNEQMTNSVNNAAKDMLTQLTASTSSPLSAGTTFNNAQKGFQDLVAEIKGGNYTNIDKAQEYAQNYLDTGRNVSKSSADYFTVFNEVTDFLKTLSTGTYGQAGTGPTNAANLPALPGVDAIVDKLSHQNDELLGVTKGVGTAIMESGADSVQVLTSINAGIQTLVGLYSGSGVANDVLSTDYLSGYGKVSKLVAAE